MSEALFLSEDYKWLDEWFIVYRWRDIIESPSVVNFLDQNFDV